MNGKENMKNVGIWIRVSTAKPHQRESRLVHFKRARIYAEFKGWTIKKVYKLITSGKSIKNHPEAQRMLKDIKEGNIQALIFSNLSRLARNIKELIDISDDFRKYNADLISLSESIDTSTPGGKLLFHVIAALSQWEREEISSRVSASVKTRAKIGKPLGGQAPFGYTWKNKEKLMINYKEAPIAKEIFETFLKTKRILTTARIINEKGYRTRKGYEWRDNSIHRLLSFSTYKGEHILNHTKSRGDGKSWIEKPQEEWEILKVEPIVNENQWEQANQILNDITREYYRKAKPPRKYLLSGYVYCEKCKTKMYGKTYGHYPSIYLCVSCRRKIECEVLDKIFVDELKTYKFNPQDLVLPVEEDSNIDNLEKKIKRLKQEENKTECLIDSLLELRTKGMIDDNTFSIRIKKYEAKRNQLALTKAKVEGELGFLNIKRNSEYYVLDKMKTFASMFPYMTFEERRAVVEEIIDKIVMSDNEIQFHMYYLPFFQKELSSLEESLRTGAPVVGLVTRFMNAPALRVL